MNSDRQSTPAPEPDNHITEILGMRIELGEICSAGLSYALEAAGRLGGVLILQTPRDLQPVLVEQKGLKGLWLMQVADPKSPLTRLIQKVLNADPLSQNGFFSANEADIGDLAAACQILSDHQVQGVLLIQGEPCTEPQRGRLSEYLPVLGREIRAVRQVDHQVSLMARTARLQTGLSELAYTGDLDRFQRHLITHLCSLFESETSLLVFEDEENPGWFTYKTLDKQGNWAYHLQPGEDMGPVSECLQTGRVLNLEGEKARIQFDPTCTDQQLLQARSMLCAPLAAGDQNFGVVMVINKSSGPYDETDQILLKTIGSLAATGLQTVNQVQQFRVTQAAQQADQWELTESRDTLRALLDNLPASLYIIDQDYRLLAVNKSRADRVGQGTQEMIGRNCFHALFGLSEACPGCRVWETLQDGITTQRSERRRLGDAITEWEIDTYPIFDGQRALPRAILLETDITEKRHLESILMQTEKLAAVGQLAAGIAHEINNPLTAIIANAQILHRELPPDTDLQRIGRFNCPRRGSCCSGRSQPVGFCPQRRVPSGLDGCE